MKKTASWKDLSSEAEKNSDLISKDSELLELKMGVKTLEKDLEEMKSILARLDKKSLKKEKKLPSGKKERKWKSEWGKGRRNLRMSGMRRYKSYRSRTRTMKRPLCNNVSSSCTLWHVRRV